MVWCYLRRLNPTALHNQMNLVIPIGVSDMLMDPYLVVFVTVVLVINCLFCYLNDVLKTDEYNKVSKKSQNEYEDKEEKEKRQLH